MTLPDVDRLYLHAAIKLAERGLYTVVRNNPRVGCLLVKDGVVIGRGWHKEDGGPHAEVDALRSKTQSAQGATAYVSLEPCCISGRTPPCTDALINAKVARVVAAMTDPNPDVSGRGLEVLRDAGIDASALELDEAKALNCGFAARMTKQRPWIRLKSAISMDGRTAMQSGESKWITGAEARADVQKWRARSAAIVTGIGTVLLDDPRLTVRDSRLTSRQPMRVVMDSKGRMPVGAKMLNEAGQTFAVVGADAKKLAHVCTKTSEASTPAVPAVFDWLNEIGANEVLVEAGPTLTGAVVDSGLWDEWIIYTAAKFMGSTSRPLAMLNIERMCDAIQGEIVDSKRFGPDTRLVIANKAA